MSFPARTKRQELGVDDIIMRSTPVTSWSVRNSLMSNSYTPFSFSEVMINLIRFFSIFFFLNNIVKSWINLFVLDFFLNRENLPNEWKEISEFLSLFTVSTDSINLSSKSCIGEGRCFVKDESMLSVSSENNGPPLTKQYTQNNKKKAHDLLNKPMILC